MRSYRILTTGAAVTALALGAAACGGGNDDDDSGSSGGSSAVAPAAAVPALGGTGTTTKVVLDKKFLKALTSLKVTPGVLGKAKLDGATLSFPITGGSVAYYKPGTVKPYVQGVIFHDGSGFSLSAGGHKVNLSDFNVDPGASLLTGKVTADGATVGDHVPLFFLNGSTLKPLRTNESGSKAVLEGTTVELTKTAAGALNGVFGIKALKKGLVIGKAKITVNTKPAKV